MITRRLALLRIASASAAATAVTAPVAMAAVLPEPTEHGGLLRLSRKLAKLDAICRRRLVAKAAARTTFEAACPSLPTELIVTRNSKELADAEQETDVDGNVVWPSEPNQPPRRYHTARALQSGLEEWQAFTDLEPEEEEIVRYFTDRLAIAERYEEEVERAIEQSGYRTASDAHARAAYAVERVAQRIATIPAATTHGLAIKAEAYQAWARSGGYQSAYKASMAIGPGLAEDICRVLSDDEARS